MSKELFDELQSCEKCRFWDWEINQWNPEKGHGKFGAFTYSDNANIMVVAQNPSHRRNPEPLNHSMSGHQGDLFRDIFGKENLILTNLVRISTPDNTISGEDGLHGYEHLKKEIDYYKPKLIILLGSFCKRFVSPMNNTEYLKHPDYYLTYNKSQVPAYIEMIKEVKRKFDYS